MKRQEGGFGTILFEGVARQPLWGFRDRFRFFFR